jgi:hypothetical protein
MNTTRGRRGKGVGLGALALLACLWAIGAGRAAGGPPAGPADDGVPSGTIAFFNGGSCPEEWQVADELRGRMIVGVTNAELAGITVGEPFSDREERGHQHTYSGQVTIPDKAIAAADGPNGNGAKAKTYDITGTTTKETSNLPFVQVQACVKP